MTHAWILLLFFHTYGAESVTMQRFDNRAACEVTKTTIEKELPDRKAYCIEDKP